MELILAYREVWAGQPWPQDLSEGEIRFTEALRDRRRGQGLRVWYIDQVEE
jgi:hypothetical protein